MTVDEYLRYDRADPWKNEYDDGVVYPVPSAGSRHNLILAGLLAALGNYLPPRLLRLREQNEGAGGAADAHFVSGRDGRLRCLRSRGRRRRRDASQSKHRVRASQPQTGLLLAD